MNVTNARATFGLNAKVTPQKAGTNGTLQIGDSDETANLTVASKIVSFDALIVGAASDLIIDISDLDNTGSTAFTAGAAQVETATAAGTITLAGNASVVVTSAGMSGSPITLAVAVANADTATVWATKVRAALNANAVIAALFTVGGSTSSISLTHKGTNNYLVNGTIIPVYPANDVTLNIALDNGTCTGITTAATSANTTAGVLTVGSYAPDLDGTDWEGEATSGLSNIYALIIKTSPQSETLLITQSTHLTDFPIAGGSSFQIVAPDSYFAPDDITLEPGATGDQSCLVTITLVGA